MILSLILGVLVGAAAVVFALQNIFAVTVTFLAWELTASLAVLLILSMLIGALVTALITIPGAIQNAFAISRLKKENQKLHDTIAAAVVKNTSDTAATPSATPPAPTI